MNFYYVETLDPEEILPEPIKLGNFIDREKAEVYYEKAIGKVLRGIAIEADNVSEFEFDITPVFDFEGEDFIERVDFFPYRNGAPLAGSLVRIVFYSEE